MKLKVKFWDTERQFFLESAISCVTAFRHYVNIPSETRFSDCENQPEKLRYIPVVHTLIRDFWEGDIVDLDMEHFWGEEMFKGEFSRCIVDYDEQAGWWYIYPINAEQAGDFDGFPLSGVVDNLKKIGNKFENPELINEAVN